MALLLCERQQNWLRVVTVVFRTIGILLRFLRFFENPKCRDFLRFLLCYGASYVFSNYGQNRVRKMSIWVGPNSHDLLCSQWTKLHRTSFAERWRNRSRSHVFPILDILSHSGDSRDKSRKLRNIAQNFAGFWGEGPKFLEFSQRSIVWQSLTMIGRGSSEGPSVTIVLGGLNRNHKVQSKCTVGPTLNNNTLHVCL